MQNNDIWKQKQRESKNQITAKMLKMRKRNFVQKIISFKLAFL